MFSALYASFSHPDFTVGSGLSPDPALTARGLIKANIRF